MAEKRRKGGAANAVRLLVEPAAAQLGLSVWEVTFTKEGADNYLRIFIDKPEGINIDDCVNMTHAVDPLLDQEDPIDGPYMLEVSSPGIDRRLNRLEHFQATLEQPVRVRLIRPMEDGRRELEGILMDVAENGDFELLLEDQQTLTFTKKECASVNRIDYFDDEDTTDEEVEE